MKYTKEILQEAVDKSTSFRGVLRALGLKQAGGNQSHIKRRVVANGIDWSHFKGKGWNVGQISRARLTPDQVFNLDVDYRVEAKKLRRALIESGTVYQCGHCDCGDSYNDKPITLHVDHIDGNWRNNKKDNLRFLCPNCHSQTKTFGSKRRIM